MKRIAILASGAGNNARNIINHFKGNNDVRIVLIASNKSDAGVLDIAKEHSIETCLLNHENFYSSDQFLQLLLSRNVNFIVLAGFLKKVPENLIKAFPHAIVNIHPALLPAYGGKGMYGHHVHEAVHDHREKESGITIHFVNEHYDEGQIIFQAKTVIETSDTPLDIERKVRALEMEYFPTVIEKILREN
ncbi:MAG: phosphoribosylglycinamide formyltransferase [Flavobacteriales bacterium]|nr:phosphoribosylglycinamide formyltransferase [Flavobacteriales bacterium]